MRVYIRQRWRGILLRLGLMHVILGIGFVYAWPVSHIGSFAFATAIAVNAFSIEFACWQIEKAHREVIALITNKPARALTEGKTV